MYETGAALGSQETGPEANNKKTKIKGFDKSDGFDREVYQL